MFIKVVEEFGGIVESPREIIVQFLQKIINQGCQNNFTVSPFISLKNVTCLNSLQLDAFKGEFKKMHGFEVSEGESLKTLFSFVQQAISNQAFLVFDSES